MAGRRGYRPPSNYDPRRGKPRKVSGRGAADENAGAGKQHRAVPAEVPANSQQSSPEPKLPPLPRVPHAALNAKRTLAADASDARFDELGLGGNIIRALAELGATTPYAVQAVTIPDAVAGYHVLGRARTGSGKTIAFGAALVERLMRLKAEGAFGAEPKRAQLKRGERSERPKRQTVRAPKALILAPTRELALQIDRTVQPIARSVGLFTAQFVGGQPFDAQLHALKRGVDIVIGTPGRIEDLALRGHLNLSQIAITVIDEADHMAELGFIEPVQRLLRMTRKGGQRMLFSATLDGAVQSLITEFMPRPAVHEIVSEDALDDERDARATHDSLNYQPPANVTHEVVLVFREHKLTALTQLASQSQCAVLFCRTRSYAEQVVAHLSEQGVSALELHGNLSQARRERNLAKFADGKVNVLVATDIAARGLHVDDIDLVVNADPPGDAKIYVHRAGRAGRNNQRSRVVSVVLHTQQKRTKQLFAELGFEPTYSPFTTGNEPEGVSPSS